MVPPTIRLISDLGKIGLKMLENSDSPHINKELVRNCSAIVNALEAFQKTGTGDHNRLPEFTKHLRGG